MSTLLGKPNTKINTYKLRGESKITLSITEEKTTTYEITPLYIYKITEDSEKIRISLNLLLSSSKVKRAWKFKINMRL